MSQPGEERPAVRPYDFWWRSPVLWPHPGDLALLVVVGWHLVIGGTLARQLLVVPSGQQTGFGAGLLFVIVVLPVLGISLAISVLLSRRALGASRVRLVWRGTWATAVGLAGGTTLVAGYFLLHRS